MERIDRHVSLDSPIIQRHLFLIIVTAEKDLSLSQLVTGLPT